MASSTQEKSKAKQIKSRVESYDGKVYAQTINIDGTVTSVLEEKEDIPSYSANNMKKSERGEWCVHDLDFSQDLLHHLQSNINFVEIDEDELLSNGFSKCCDHPSIPNHIYYEGYFHALETSASIESINPRFGVKYDKPAAALAFRAFIAAFKSLNDGIWIKEAVKGTFLDKTNLSNNLFCDIAVQIHFGDAITPKDIVWHKDNVNSMLHLALSMKGRRALHYEINEDMILINNEMNSNININTNSKEIKWQNEGNCYLSSPYAFLHAVEYPMCSFKDRIIAIQCRWLYDLNEYSKIIEYHDEWRAAMNHITNILSKVKVKMPSLQQVLEMEKQIKENQIDSMPVPINENTSSYCVLL